MSDHLESLGRLRLQALLLLLAVFVIGVLAGAAFERASGHRPGPPPDEPHGLPPGMRERLDLTAEQTRRIEALLDRNRARTDAVLDEYLPRLRTLTDSMRADVRAVLTAEQQRTFDRLEKEGPPRTPHERDWPRRDDAPPGSPPPPPPPPR
jgi:Spy/CpxP family protein refolding chaperone